ncbi:MAG: DUF2380 domain-containing protein, partial [Lachnospiraceae bacterium]|nr:DUF2380 domain-containing protein [Lachnospiraceae bacterium]
DILSMASMIPGHVGAIAAICDIGLSYATGDFSALGKSLLSAIITGGFKTYINNACKIPKALKYIAGAVFAGYGLSIISKSYTIIRDSALQFVDLMFSGGSPLDYAHVLCNFFQGLAGLAGGVGFAVGSAVGMVRQCFVAGTKVKTEDGDKNIEEIKAGDIVWSYDPLTGEEGLKEVKQTFKNETETLVHVTVSNENDKETIDTTVRHPFYVVGYGFRYASELRIGDKVRSVSGDIYEVTSVEIEKLDEPVKIYNFEVEDWHTYFVSESGILVHNDGCGTGTPNTTEDTKQQDTDNITNQSASAPEGKGGSKSNIPLIETSKYISGKTADHHIIPKFRGKSKPYADFIAERGIDVDQYTITVSSGKEGMHMNSIHGKGDWNPLWMEWIDNHPDATAKDIFQFAGKMMDDFGLSGYEIHPFHKGGK